jgi:hypothetical protein
LKANRIEPRYPIYIPSKARADRCLTARCLRAEGTPFFLVVEPPEVETYAAKFGRDCLLVLPFEGVHALHRVRNWIKDHATAAGHLRHWQLDDNIYRAQRVWNGERYKCRLGLALAVVEDFTDRYENIAVSGMNYTTFVIPSTTRRLPPFYHNVHVYSCSLVLNAIPHRWRRQYNDDTDLCLQVLADGWCTVLINVFSVKKVQTLTMRGGNADIYQADGRLRMARSLERDWPGVVTVIRRFKRAQHNVAYGWRRFATPLKLKPGIVLADLEPNEYGLTPQK